MIFKDVFNLIQILCNSKKSSVNNEDEKDDEKENNNDRILIYNEVLEVVKEIHNIFIKRVVNNNKDET